MIYTPSESNPTSLDANVALPYGGVCRTARPDAANVRIRIGGNVNDGKRGRTWRNVAGGISAAINKMPGQHRTSSPQAASSIQAQKQNT